MRNGVVRLRWNCKRCVSEAGRRAQDKKRDWNKRNPEKRKAHKAVEVALVNGTISKRPCACGSTKVHAHHDDYSMPLDVRWLCSPCHRAHHRIHLPQQQMSART